MTYQPHLICGSNTSKLLGRGKVGNSSSNRETLPKQCLSNTNPGLTSGSGNKHCLWLLLSPTCEQRCWWCIHHWYQRVCIGKFYISKKCLELLPIIRGLLYRLILLWGVLCFAQSKYVLTCICNGGGFRGSVEFGAQTWASHEWVGGESWSHKR